LFFCCFDIYPRIFNLRNVKQFVNTDVKNLNIIVKEHLAVGQAKKVGADCGGSAGGVFNPEGIGRKIR